MDERGGGGRRCRTGEAGAEEDGVVADELGIRCVGPTSSSSSLLFYFFFFFVTDSRVSRIGGILGFAR